jgi:deoxyhypusine synthase
MGAELGEAGVPARDMVDALEGVRSILLKPSERLDDKRFTRIAGADFDDAGLGLAGLLGSLASTGFQASNLGDAIDVVNQMVRFAWQTRSRGQESHENCEVTDIFIFPKEI